jgi:signal peptidase II
MNIFRIVTKKFFSKTIIVPILVFFFVFVFDRVTKIFIINHQLNDQSIFVNVYLNLELVWNTGIGFGLLSLDANIYYHLISLVIFSVIIFLFYLINKAIYVEKILFSLILGGAAGNLYDRLVYFAVPDFIDFHIKDFHWFTFNIADIFITLGIILIIAQDLLLKKK